jgi:hypothetical protein
VPRKVIAFDSWTGGANNLERLVDAFAERDLELLLIHVGSWGHDPGKQTEERIGKLRVRDIAFYGGKSLPQIIETERPDAVLFLSTQAFVHRAFNRYCARIGIPTLHLYHGIVNVQSTKATRLNPLNLRSQAALAFSRLGKNLRCIWPTYAAALWRTQAGLKEWWWFAYDVWRQVSGRQYAGPAASDASTSACCVYTETDVSHAVGRYGMARASVHVVGNPDLLRFRLNEADLGSSLRRHADDSRVVMYVDTALIEAGAVFDSAEEFARHLRATQQALATQGFRLAVKLHPAHARTGVQRLLTGIDLCEDDFLARLKHCCAVITEPTSAALIPALLGLPLFLARYDALRDQQYGDVLTGYPNAVALHGLDDFSELLAKVRRGANEAQVTRWIAANVGPLPAADMPRRVASTCVSIMERARS